jgi:hypothetical protein
LIIMDRYEVSAFEGPMLDLFIGVLKIAGIMIIVMVGTIFVLRLIKIPMKICKPIAALLGLLALYYAFMNGWMY